MIARFISFEGIDGGWKSTQVSATVGFLAAHGIAVEQTREPGGTPLAEKVRELLLHEPMYPETETLLLFAARWQHLAEKIEPALAAGRWVVSDRFTDATYAYQVGGRGLDPAKLATMETWVHPARQPDLCFLFDLDPAVAAQRIAGTRAVRADRFECECVEFFTRVRNAYLDRAIRNSSRFYVVDAARSSDSIAREIRSVLRARFLELAAS